MNNIDDDTFIHTHTCIGSSAIDSHLSQLRQARNDTIGEQVTYKPQTIASESESKRMNAIDSAIAKNQQHSNSSHQHEHVSLKDEFIQTTSEGISVATSSSTEEPHQIMLHCNDKLVTALSADPLGIAGIFLARGLISEHTEAQMQQYSTPHEKATILVTTVRQRIKIAPKRFQEFLDILAEQGWTKDILEILQSSGIPLKKDVYLRSSDDHSPSKSEPANAMPSSEQSSSSEEYTFPTLNPDDEAELEAQLITSAESMKKKFAALVWKTVESFKCQKISPRSLITGVLYLTEGEDPFVGKPLLEREKERLAEVQNIDTIFDILRPHMTFFNYEILEFLIETIGSKKDKQALTS